MPRVLGMPAPRLVLLLSLLGRRGWWGGLRENWLKLNADAASKGNPGLAGAGGVIRDGNGRWWHGLQPMWDTAQPFRQKNGQ